MTRCTRCVLPDTFPGIHFDDAGVCSYCRAFDGQKPAGVASARLKETFNDLIEKARGSGARYHAVVAYSGGKDSTYLLHLLRASLGLRPLAVTFDNGFLSEASFRNMRRVVAALDVDHVIVRPRRDQLNAIFTHSALGRVYPDDLTRYGSAVCISCIRMVMTSALRTAIEKQIPLVMLGNSPGQVLRSEEELIYQDNRIPFALREQLFARLAERTGRWAYDHLMLTRAEYAARPFPTFVCPLPILGYDEAEIYRTIADLGWQKPGDVDPTSTNCRLNAFGIVRHQNVYRFHPYDYEMSELVRLGAIGRDAALARVTDPGDAVAALAGDVERELSCGACGAADEGN